MSSHGIPTTLQLPPPPPPPQRASPEWRAYYNSLQNYHYQLQEAIRAMYKEVAVRSNEMILQEPLVDRPDAGVVNRLFVDTTNNELYYDNGTSWVLLT